ncbi:MULTISPECIES: amino acid ABC transporter permease [unclassified Nocardioides]|uniref:amino acid ABC transporter permease n=1 Tax=unclassified Nocardioides TaxID=2615069 RepID=UPI001152387B|nr:MULTISPECIES: amino acid ABC transporter permease [unclassified Nocardioides]WGY02776.1 amino acid ABC transporter permease [Nocardioides sp. QY071]
MTETMADRTADSADDAAWDDHLAHLAAIPHARRLHLLRILLAVVLVAAAGRLGWSIVENPAFEWATVRSYFFSDPVLTGLKNTITLTALSMGLALVVSVLIANLRLSDNPVLRAAAGAYVWFFRSVPLLVLLILWFNISLIYPTFSIPLPGGGWTWETRDLMTAYWSAVLAFGLQQAAYTSEIIRASLLAVPAGQREAALALGMPPGRIFRRIVFPQAMKIAVPPVSNDLINLLKATALVAFISVPDLLYSVQQIYNRTFEVVPLLMVATVWYMILVSILSLGQFYLERWLGRSAAARVSPRGRAGRSTT